MKRSVWARLIVGVCVRGRKGRYFYHFSTKKRFRAFPPTQRIDTAPALYFWECAKMHTWQIDHTRCGSWKNDREWGGLPVLLQCLVSRWLKPWGGGGGWHSRLFWSLFMLTKPISELLVYALHSVDLASFTLVSVITRWYFQKSILAEEWTVLFRAVYQVHGTVPLHLILSLRSKLL
jgi:hypothetical protein